jgi:two-component system chemotaxis response regulator CheB
MPSWWSEPRPAGSRRCRPWWGRCPVTWRRGHRPAVDALFRSAARARGSRVIGVVLSGTRDDGAAGVLAVANRGGVVIVQDPREASHSSMPRAALEAVPDARVREAATIGPLIGELLKVPMPAGPTTTTGPPTPR